MAGFEDAAEASVSGPGREPAHRELFRGEAPGARLGRRVFQEGHSKGYLGSTKVQTFEKRQT